MTNIKKIFGIFCNQETNQYGWPIWTPLSKDYVACQEAILTWQEKGLDVTSNDEGYPALYLNERKETPYYSPKSTFLSWSEGREADETEIWYTNSWIHGRRINQNLDYKYYDVPNILEQVRKGADLKMVMHLESRAYTVNGKTVITYNLGFQPDSDYGGVGYLLLFPRYSKPCLIRYECAVEQGIDRLWNNVVPNLIEGIDLITILPTEFKK